MKHLTVFKFESWRFVWGVAERDYEGRFTQLFAPIFTEEFTAEVFAEVLEKGGLTEEGTDLELGLARAVERFIEGWNEAHGDDDRYPTPDGQYPKAKLMAQWFLEAHPAYEGAPKTEGR